MKKILAVIIVLCELALFSGCGNVENQHLKKTNQELKFPLKEKVVLTCWKQENSLLSGLFAKEEEAEFYRKMEELTNIHIEFITPPLGQEKEHFNLLIASGELPDLVEGGWGYYPGGLERAYEDGLIVGFSDYVEEYAPNYNKIINDNEFIKNSIQAGDGNIFMFPFLRLDEKLRSYAGPVLREDWLRDLNLPVPETIDEWHTVLTAFKNEKKATAPLTFMEWQLRSYPAFYTAFGLYPRDFYYENGVAKFYAIEPGYKALLETFSQWYAEGLIDPDFATVNSNMFDIKIYDGMSGAFIAAAGGSGIGKYMDNMRNIDPEFSLVGAPYPVLEKGTVSKFGHYEGAVDSTGSITITSSNEHLLESMMWLDYAYGEEGHMLNNFGFEGLTYEMKDGKPVYTEFVFDNPDGQTVGQVLSRYMRANSKGAFVQDLDFYLQYLKYPQQKEAFETWQIPRDYTSLPILGRIQETNTGIAKMTDIKEYVEEMFYKFVMGRVSIDQFDEYVQTIKSMGIDEILSVRQENYNKSMFGR